MPRTVVVGVLTCSGGGTSPHSVPAVRGPGPGLVDFGWAPRAAPDRLSGADECAAAAALSYSAPRGATLAGAITSA